MIDQEALNAILTNLSESRSLEVKRWIDPKDKSGKAKIARGVLALRNANGGYFVVGFNDDDLRPDTAHEPADAKQLFHVDAIQAIVSHYSFELFEIEVGWGQFEGHEYPIIIVPAGVRFPVAAKRDLPGDDGKPLVRTGAVYFRTLATNNIISTAEAMPADWQLIADICFDNREADIGRFARRHLAGLDLGALVEGMKTSVTPSPTLRERAHELLLDGDSRYAAALSRRSMTGHELALLDFGFWSVALVIDPPRSDILPDDRFRRIIAAANPNLTPGWPVWLDARTRTNPDDRPISVDNGDEYLIVSMMGGWSNHVDFARFDPSGKFYLTRLLQEDGVPDRLRPREILDPLLAIRRVAEAIAVGIAYAKDLGWPTATTNLGFAFRWSRLSGRDLQAWSDMFSTVGGGKAHDDMIETYVEVPLDTPLSAISQKVDEATQRLFVAFDATRVDPREIETLVRKVISRQS